jgi:hypothetical protein
MDEVDHDGLVTSTNQPPPEAGRGLDTLNRRCELAGGVTKRVLAAIELVHGRERGLAARGNNRRAVIGD